MSAEHVSTAGTKSAGDTAGGDRHATRSTQGYVLKTRQSEVAKS
jgi:hypothetical protein